MDGTILSQGTFTQPATAVNQTIAIPSGVDFLEVYNYTQAAQATSAGANGFYFYWQRNLNSTTGIVEIAGAMGAVTVDVTAANAFVLFNPTTNVIGNAVATTASTNATRPVVSTATTTGLAVGSVVRMSSTAQTDVNGVDMVVGAVTPGMNFTLLTATNALATAPGAIGGAGFYRIINTDPIFYPRRRFVANITQAVNAQVSTTVAHGYTVGQEVRFTIPAESGMIELNGTTDNNYQPAIVESVVDAYNFTINIDTSAFTAFSWPTIAQQPSSFPLVVPFGEDTSTALTAGVDILADATRNTAYLGMTLATGALLPGGVANDVIVWKAGKSTLGGS